MLTVMSLGPTNTATTPGIEQILSKFSTPRTDSIIGMKTVPAFFSAIDCLVASLGHCPVASTRSSTFPFNGRYTAAAAISALVFAIIPAFRASRLRPVKALRYE